jgi:Antibiotic biosynthesis monooxygenase
MRRVLIRYKVKPDQVERNEELVRAVYEELDRTKPDGFRYTTLKLDDGATFVHIALYDDAPSENALNGNAAFERFQDGIRDRCDEPPVLSHVEVVGSYRVLG